jgi:membrane-associated HD superfamily phosphohydrolase
MKKHLVNIHLEMKTRYPSWWKAGWFCLLLFAIFLLFSLIDQRHVNSINTWYKPMKFCLSVGIYLLTIIWVIDLLNISQKRKSKLITFISFIILLELLLIIIQGARGIASHYNISSIFNVVIFQLMGICIAINTIVLIWVTVLYFKKKSRPKHISKHMTNLIMFGLMLLLFSSAIGGKMIGLNQHTTSPENISKLYIPFLDWKLGSGDLRISHFLGMHGLQIFALAGIYINATPNLLKLISLYTLVILYCLIVISVFLFALN